MPTGTSPYTDPYYQYYGPYEGPGASVSDPTFGAVTNSNVGKVADSVSSKGGLPSWVIAVLSIVKEIGLPALAIIKGSRVLKQTGSIADLANPVNNAQVDTSDIEKLKAALNEAANQKQTMTPSPDPKTRKAQIFGVEVDFSSPITWLFILMLLFVLYTAFASKSGKKTKGFFNF